MAQLASLATVLGTGATLYSTARQAEAQRSTARAQAEQAAAQQQARTQQLAAEQVAEARNRQVRLDRTIASARARLAAGGVSPDGGSAAALEAGLRQDAAMAQQDSDAVFSARLSAGRRSLLNDDGSLTAWLRAGTSFGNSLRSLLD